GCADFRGGGHGGAYRFVVVDAAVRQGGAHASDVKAHAVSNDTRKLMSTETAEWVNAPTEIKSAPVVAYSRSFSRRIPPDNSTVARPAMKAIHSEASSG